jgi:hypothetical protein
MTSHVGRQLSAVLKQTTYETSTDSLLEEGISISGCKKSVSENHVSLTVLYQFRVHMRRTNQTDPTRISCRQRNYAPGGAANSSRRNKFATGRA